DEITFYAPVKNNCLTFEIEFPDAKAASSVISESKDERILACALQSMIIRNGSGYSGERLIIKFSGDDYNADLYVRSGISYKEENFSWTNGKRMQVSAPVEGEYDSLRVKLRIGEPFNARQTYIVRQGERELLTGVIEKPGEISFAASVADNQLSFEIEFPDARVVNEVLLESSDERMVACQLLEM
ncbi:MAG: hypothetical protein K2N94_10100, partial [Lachnospiraceae bacterium]|nr:hypothetical protein [Lachnospiraceae bacterium]